MRDVPDVDFDRYIPQHVRDNHTGRVESEFGGDWNYLARQFEAAGDTLLAKWAAAQAEPVKAADKAPRGRRAAE